MTTQAAGPLLLAAIALALPLVEGGPEHGQAHRPFFSAAAPAPRAASGATVRAGNTLYLAGQLGIDPRTGRAPADGEAEARLLMEAVRHTLAAAGLHMDDLVWVTVISTDAQLNGAFDAVYRSYFRVHFPPHAFVGAAALRGGAHFELLGVAVREPLLQL